MADMESLLSTLFHMGVEKVGLTSATRTLLLPHVPKIIRFVTDGFQNNDLITMAQNNVITTILLFLTIFIFYSKRHKINIWTDKVFDYINSKLFVAKKLEKAGISSTTINVANPIDVISTIKFVKDNINSNEYFEWLSMGEVELITHVNYDEVSRNSYSRLTVSDMGFLKDNFMKESIILPKQLTIRLKIPEDTFKISTVDIIITAEIEKPKPLPIVGGDKNAAPPLQPIENDNDILKKIRMSVTLKYPSKNNINTMGIYTHFNKVIHEYMEKKYYQQQKNKRSLTITKYVDADTSISLYNGSIITKKESLNRYLGNYIHQQSDTLTKMINSFIEDCKKKQFDCFTPIIPHLSLLIYGPPGSGKSTLADRIALALQRNVKMFNIKKYYTLSKVKSFIRHYRTSSYVILIDEMDKFIEILMEDMKLREELAKENKLKEVEPDKETSNEDPDVYEDDEDNNNDNSKEKKKEKEKYVTQPKYNYNIDDLLTIFDESMMASGAVTVATTNNPETIRNIGKGGTRGAMVRAGRLKLFKLDYFDKETIDKLITIKYGKDHNITIPDSWFNEMGNAKIQNSNFISILKSAEKDELINLVNQDIENYEALQLME